MPNFSGVWNLKEQIQAAAAGRWTGVTLSELYAWGRNTNGQVGDNTTAGKSSPVQVGEQLNWADVAGGDSHTLAVAVNGTLWAWGDNSPDGQLGLGDIIDRSSPTQVGALTDWFQISAGSDHSVAVKTDGTLWAWGYSFNGQLGLGDRVSRSSPVQVGALTNWSQVASGPRAGHTAAIKTDGTLWTWGENNNNGQLGNGTIIDRSSPVQVGALTNWSQVAAGRDHTAAVKTDGTIWAWGRNNNGQIGDGTILSRSSPVQIGALTNWSQTTCGQYHTAAVKTAGTVWVWGNNSFGQIGDNTTANKSSPVQVGSLTNWAQASSGGRQISAVKTDGTLWAWGYNGNGNLGDGTTVRKSSPVQVGTLTGWTFVGAGNYHTAAVFQSTVA